MYELYDTLNNVIMTSIISGDGLADIDAMFDEGVDGIFNRIAFTSRSTFGD